MRAMPANAAVPQKPFRHAELKLLANVFSEERKEQEVSLTPVRSSLLEIGVND